MNKPKIIAVRVLFDEDGGAAFKNACQQQNIPMSVYLRGQADELSRRVNDRPPRRKSECPGNGHPIAMRFTGFKNAKRTAHMMRRNV